VVCDKCTADGCSAQACEAAKAELKAILTDEQMAQVEKNMAKMQKGCCKTKSEQKKEEKKVEKKVKKADEPK
jgi:hypothetical protein